MKAIQFDISDLDFPAALVEVDEPSLPNDAWARVAVTSGGICGSDLHLFQPSGEGSPTLASGDGPFPAFIFGHEIAGTVIEAGASCPVTVGTRVAVDPSLPCSVRGIDPPCANCARGWSSSCLALDSRIMTPGRSLGYTEGLGGGWAEQVVAHSLMLYPLPDQVSDRVGSLHEPISIGVHGLARRPPEEGAPVLIVGGGLIGLTALLAVRSLCPSSEVTVMARHQHQAEAARACGAAHVVMASGEEGFNQLAELTGGRSVGRGDERMLMGGFPYVIEAAGSAGSVNDSLRAAHHRGTVVILGALGYARIDMTPVWYKELDVIGAIDQPEHPSAAIGAGAHGKSHPVEVALEVLRAAPSGLDEVLVTHEFPVEGYREAIGAALDKHGTQAIKVVFRPGEG
jgi:threonine dehydrogenase-like Zn-dependent dehydrogenase